MAQPLDQFPETLLNCSTWVTLLRQRTLHQPEQLTFSFLPDGETEGASLTYRELDRLSRAIAAQLQALGLSGERALLLYPPGLAYIAAFFGCLYAGVVAVPAYPPRNQRNTPRIQAVVADAQAQIALTTTAILSQVQSLLAEKTDLGDLQWLTTDSLESGIEDNWQEPFISTDTLAFLQYTSGSTGTPKGVMLSHGNLLHNAAMTYRLMGHSPSSKFVSWLPTYHDMGLIGGTLQPLYGGFPCILMPPAAFLQRPYRWLQVISRYQGTTSGAPNFAYELCIHKITPEQQKMLDLSTWSVAFNGAEPIRQDTLEKFYAKFASCGFRRQVFYPCYGMAEATLMVSGGLKTASPAIKTIQGDALERNQVIEAGAEHRNVHTLVSCGHSLPLQQIVIAHPETLTRCLPNEVGEIWVSSPSVGQGYWNRPKETEQTFLAYLSDTGEGPFLRTGDLGFLHNGELFVTGRVKDLIIIRGRNLYPQDIELTAEQSHPTLRLGSVATFSVEVDDEERLVVVQELDFRQKPNVHEVTAAIRQAVAEEHEVQVYAVVLIKPGSIPKTSSGKIQRRACRAEFLAGNLEVIDSSILESADVVGTVHNLKREALKSVAPGECQPLLESYLQKLVAQVLKIAPSQVNSQQPLSSLGLDSLKVFELKNRIEVDLEVAVSIADFFEGFSTQALATKLLAQLTTEAFIPSVPLTKVQTATDLHPLSFAQARLWFLDQLETGNPAYNISFTVHLKGLLNVTLLEQSLNEIVRRHKVLRTTFSTAENQPIQVIVPSLTLPLPVVNCQFTELEFEGEVQRWATQESQQPFDLSKGPLLRAKLLCLAQQEHILLLSMHHIIADEWSVEVLLREMAALYKAFLTGTSPLPELPIQYKDFAYWQRQWLQREGEHKASPLQIQLAYWKQQLDGAPAVLQLPTDRPRPAVQTYRGAQQSLELPKTLSEALKALSRQEGVTLFMVLLAAFQTFLYRYTGQDDILVGSPIANRNHSDLKGLIGFFVNTLVLRTYLGGNPSFQELLGRVRQVALGAYAHQDLPFEQLVEVLRPERDVSYTPLFQVSFILRNALQLEEIPSLALSPLKVESLGAQFDLSLLIEITERGLIASFEYNTDLFDATTIARMLGHFQNLLLGIVVNPQARLLDLPLLTPAEQHQLLVTWNNTQADYPQDLCIHQLFEAQVEREPDAVAVVFENQQLSYRELNRLANQLAHHLQALGVEPEVKVGIYMERSFEMVVAVLGVLKAGGVYVPLDPGYPPERLVFMLADAQLSVLLTQKALVEKLPDQAQVVVLDTYWQVIAGQSEENPISGVMVDNSAYAIYTSGSTGKPKGVVVNHQNLVHSTWARNLYYCQPVTSFLLLSSLAFDSSVAGIFWTLCQGAILVLPQDFQKDLLQLTKLIVQHRVSHLLTVPSFWKLLLEQASLPQLDFLHTVIVAGEACIKELVERHYQQLPQTSLFNEYGPTEGTVWSSVYDCQSHELRNQIPIGRPIANTQLYLLDTQLQPVPVGVSGELYISGAGVVRGYLNRPELTSEKFIPNPFSHLSGDRLYKTGDLACYLPDGNIKFIGRIDHQVKLRGFRLELGEIEAVLNQYPKVQEVVAIVREDEPGDKRLVAYIVPSPEQTLVVRDLRCFLKEQLPDYMVPSAFMLLDTLPLLPNGKVDRRALPAPDSLRPTLVPAYEAPRSEVERAIAAVWQTLLHLEKVGVNDNFFDLGGHSLLMVQVNSKLREIFDQDLSIIEMFQNPTIKSLAQYISQMPEDHLSFGSMRDRVQKQIQAINQRKKRLGIRGKRKI